METNNPKAHDNTELPQKEKTYVYSIRDWKDYLGESLLIVFSVLLALFLTEYISKIHDRKNTKGLLNSIALELKRNKKSMDEMNRYNLIVLGKIDRILQNPELQQSIVKDGEFILDSIAPDGVLYRYLESDVWTIAKSNNINSKVNTELLSTLNKVYEDIERTNKVEDEVAKVIFDRASRDPKQVRITLLIIKDIYHGWAVDRAQGLISRIDATINKIKKEL